jgi:hypothetical protein
MTGWEEREVNVSVYSKLVMRLYDVKGQRLGLEKGVGPVGKHMKR